VDAQSYASFSLAMNRRVAENRAPAHGTIEVTRRCPLQCAHCYNNLPLGDSQAKNSELTLAEHKRLIDQITEMGCLWLLYTGGEIFARKDFLDIYTYAKKSGLIITLFTNGTLITPKIIEHLLKYRPFSIEITLYGRTREVYERLTGIPGSYDRCINGIRLIKESGLSLKLKTVAVSINKHELWEMKRFSEEELGIEFKFDAMMNPRIDCSQSPLEVRLSAEEIVELDLKDARRVNAWREFAEKYNGPVPRRDKDNIYHCGGGLTSFAIDPYGGMSICVLSQRDIYDLRQGTFKEGWESFLQKVRNRKRTLATKCVDCQIKPMCGMCPANGELENGNAEMPVDFLCHAAHLRAKVMDFEVPSHGECDYCPTGKLYAKLLDSARNISQGKLVEYSSRYLPVFSEKKSSCSSCH
jgi:radical SAM protein with 4Fe4S-binding SPASM domain